MERRQVTVRVPATSGNLGPGFDCLGMALDWWNDVHMGASSAPAVRILGEGADTLDSAEDNLVYRAAQALFREAGEDPPCLSIVCENRIPLARGLGSSAAAIVGGLVAANALCSRPLDRQRLLDLAVRMEGHADNVAPALLGGCQVVVRDGDRVVTDAVPISPDLRAIVLVPDLPMSTRDSRAALPGEVAREGRRIQPGEGGPAGELPVPWTAGEPAGSHPGPAASARASKDIPRHEVHTSRR